MRTLLLSALVIGGLVFARPAFAEDPLAPLTMDEDPLAPLTTEPSKSGKSGKVRPKPKPRPKHADKPARPPADKPDKPTKPEKVEVVRKVNADRIKVSGVPPMPLRPGQSATLTFRVMDSAGRTIAAEVSLIANIGTITDPVETSPGIFSATYAPPATGLDNIATIRADVKNSVRPVHSETKIGVVPERPKPPPAELPALAELVEKPKPAKIAFADLPDVEAGQPVQVRFQLQDEQGNLVPAEGVTLKADQGSFENLREESGTYVADYVPAKDASGDVRIFAEAGGERLSGGGSLSVRAAPAEGQFGFAAGLLVGGLTNYGKVISPQFELNVEAKLFSVLRLGVLAGYSPAFASGVQDQDALRTADFSFTVIPLMVRAAYQQAVGPISIFGGGMIGVAIVNGTATAQSTGAQLSFSQTPLDMAAFVGGGLPLGPGMLVLEIRASWMKLDYADESVVVKGNLGGFSGALGYKFEF